MQEATPPKKNSQLEEELEESFSISEDFKEPDIDILKTNPFLNPLGIANEYSLDIIREDQYETLVRKVQQRTEFISSKIPPDIRTSLQTRMHGYWTCNKLAQVNPHHAFSPKLFTPGSTHMIHDVHLVVVCPMGKEAYQECYLNLPLTHKVVSYPQFGCAGTFLSCDEDIRRYLKHEPLQQAIKADMEIPIERPWKGERGIEFLTHTALDIRDESIFLVVEKQEGSYTQMIREAFPMHQIISIIPGIEFNEDDYSSIYIATQEYLKKVKRICPRSEYRKKGFYFGQTYFLADLSYYYRGTKGMGGFGMMFGIMGTLARLGPDHSGVIWGSTGGAEGAIKAARALFGNRGAQGPADLQRAVEWADQLRKG